MKYGVLVDTAKNIFGGLLVEFDIQVIGEGIVSGSLNCWLSRGVLDHFSLSDKIINYKYLMGKSVKLHQRENYRRRLPADQGQGEGVVCGSSAFSGVEYKCSDGLPSGLIDCGLSRRVQDCISLSDKIKIYKYLMRKCVESHVSENSRTNKLPSLSTFIPCWDESSHLTGWLLVQYMYLSVWCVGVVPVYVVLYILYLLFCVYSGVVIYSEIAYMNPGSA